MGQAGRLAAVLLPVVFLVAGASRTSPATGAETSSSRADGASRCQGPRVVSPVPHQNAATLNEALRRVAAVLPLELVLHAFEFVPGPVRVASSPGTKAAVLWEGGPGFSERRLQNLAGHDFPVVGISFFPRADRLVTVAADGTSTVWRAMDGRKMQTFYAKGSFESITEAQVFPDGERIVLLSIESGATVRSLVTGEILQRFDTLGICEVHQVVRVLRGERIVTGVSWTTGDPNVIWNVTDGSVMHRLDYDGDTWSLATSPCGSRLATVGTVGAILWDTSTGALLHALPSAGRHPETVWISSGGAFLVGASQSSIIVWDGLSGQPRRQHSRGPHIVEFVMLPSGDRVVVFTMSQVVVLDLDSGEQLGHLAMGEGDLVQSVQASARSDVVAACGVTPEETWAEDLASVWTRVWHVASGRLLHESYVHDALETFQGISLAACTVSVSGGSLLDWLAD